MSNQKPHTSGPLEVGFYTPTVKFLHIPEHHAVMGSDGSLVAVTGASHDPQSEADARLFAGADDLLTVAIRAEYIIHQLDGDGWCVIREDILTALRTAIAKAISCAKCGGAIDPAEVATRAHAGTERMCARCYARAEEREG